MTHRHRPALLLVVALGLAFSVVARAQDTPDAAPDDLRAGYHQAIEKAMAWLDELTVDPVALQQQDVKGKKKLAEILDAYLTLYNDYADDATREHILERVRDKTVVTSTPAYHDMNEVDDEVFKQNSTSYMRVAYLMDHFGLDIEHYRAQLAKALPRLGEHMRVRGVSQRMSFATYYDYLGFEKPEILQADHVRHGVIVNRLPVAEYTRLQTYNLTHEIFAAFEYGRVKTSDVFDADDIAYCRATIPLLLSNCILNSDPDLGGELLSCLTYLNLTDVPIHDAGVRWLLAVQRPNGTWGDYEAARPHMGGLVEQNFYLHTTLVVIQCLVETFDGGWPGGRG